MDACRLGTIHTVSGTFGDLTKELTTVVSPSIFSSQAPQFELFNELHDLWPLVRPI
jgi:hypothetical protein